MALRRGLLLCGIVAVSSGFMTGCGSNSETDQSEIKIIGGEEVKDGQADNRRWSTVAITTDYEVTPGKGTHLANGKSFCSGTLVGRRIVVTAAHCIQKFDEVTKKKLPEYILPKATDYVVSFDTKVSQQGNWRRAAQVIAHPDWSPNETLSPQPTTPPNDIGVIILAEDAPALAKVATIADTDIAPEAGSMIDLAGYGITSNRNNNDTGILRQVQTMFKTLDGNIQRFSVGQLFKGACAGDSGGPAYIQVDGEYQLMGATSTGIEIGGYCLGMVANYTDARYYHDWILKH